MKSILSVLIFIMSFSSVSAQSNFYTNPKFSFGYSYPDGNPEIDSTVGIESYCHVFDKPGKRPAKISYFETTGHKLENLKLEEYVRYLPDYIANTFEDKPGDTVMVIFGQAKCKAIIDNIGVVDDMCEGITPLCNLKVLGSNKLADSSGYGSFMVLRRGYFYDGIVKPIDSLDTIEPGMDGIIDSIKTIMRTIDAGQTGNDSIEVTAFPIDGSRDSIFLRFYLMGEVEIYSSRLYKIAKNNHTFKIQELLKGSTTYDFVSAFDLDIDGNLEYFMSLVGIDEETLAIFTFKNGEWIKLYSHFHQGC